MSSESENTGRSRSKSPLKITVTNDEVTNSLIRDLVKKRGIIKGRFTRFSNFVNALQTESDRVLSLHSKEDLKLRVQGGSKLFAEFSDLQSKIEESVLEIDLEEQLIQREQFEDCYYSTLARAECLLKEEGIASSSKTISSDSVKLPTISVPTFDGTSEHWLQFRDTFSSLVHDSNKIGNIQKFHYLKSSLIGSAALVIDSIEFCADNYLVAWELLLNRYNNYRLLVHNHVKALFNIPNIIKGETNSLRNLIDTILKNLRSLKKLGEPVDSWDTLIIYLVVSKLDKISEREWEQYKSTVLKQSNNSKSPLKVDELLSFLKDRADMLETLQANQASHANSNVKKPSQQYSTKVHCNVSTNKPQNHFKKSCSFCNNGYHRLFTCQQFLSTNLDTKLKFVTDNKLCENCLRPGHNVNVCRFGPCKQCNQRHNSLLHRDVQVDRSLLPRDCDNNKQVIAMHSSLSKTARSPCRSYSNTHTDVCSHYSGVQPILLSTAIVEVSDIQNNYHKARALLDSGSERCFITSSLCKLLQLPMIQSTQEIRGVGNSITQSSQICEIEIKSSTSSYITRMQCFVLSNISSTTPGIPIQHSIIRIPDHIQLADPSFYEPQSIDILIGADKFWDLLSDGRMRLSHGPFLQNTRLGWIISGPVGVNMRSTTGQVQCNFSQNLDTQLRQFWELEELTTPCQTLTDEEKECENIFIKTTRRDKDGRFCVSIPLKSSPNDLGESYPQALKRFLSLEKRLQNNIQYKNLYSDFIHEYINLGHMTRVNAYGTPNYILAHHGVLREHSSSTKLRVVFDASASSSSGRSFNDLQLVGPPIQGDLLAILLRMRQHRYIACADIEKMYRQVLVTESQRDLQLILWRDDPTESIDFYRLNTVTYGTASAPFLAVRCLKQLSMDCEDRDVMRVIAEDFYVDDLVTGLDDKHKLIELCDKISNTLKAGCFPLRKWIFNFECDQSIHYCNDSKNLNMNNNQKNRTLGLGWNYLSDELYYESTFNNDCKITKRTILSYISQIFDPLGLLSPAIIIAKVLLQKLWLHRLDWDDALPRDVTADWNRFANSLSALESIRIPRHVIANNFTRLELHIFTDASQTAYGTCIYVRSIIKTNNNTSIINKLLCSKGKVAPLKPVSVPRLELCGALLGARLYAKVRESLRCEFAQVVFWTDSTIVLGWLRMAPNLLKTFVQNRVVEIHDLTKGLLWRHVSGKDNPADLVSRGMDVHNLASSNLWWQGPTFLHSTEFVCNGLTELQLSNDLPELRPGVVHVYHSEQNAERNIITFTRFSQYQRLLRTFAYVLRFINNIRPSNTNKINGELRISELRNSEMRLARLAQIESFSEEYQDLSKGLSLKHKPSLFKLNLFIDNDLKLLRVGGRIGHSEEFDYNKRHPILLSSKHHFTILLLKHKHINLFHAAPQALLYSVREQWWPIGGRSVVRKIVHDCIICKRFLSKTLNPIMGNLPKERLTPTYPFLYSGVDYAGPVLTLNRKGRGAKTCKSYICLFVCFVSRAIHLELVSDLSSASYILALKRFISRRGKPAEIYSDNGRNFVGAMKEFSKFISNCSKDISNYAITQSIKFKFIPPYTPHFGGLWEAGVKSCKHHLMRVVGNAHLTFEEFTTVLTQVEAILNSRPLSPMSADPQDLLPLSPAHFLVGRSLTAPVYQDMRTDPGNIRDRYQRVELIRHHFWSRWAKEYVSELQTRCKWKENVDSLQPGTLVLLKDDHLPPLKWNLGRIISTVPGNDGVSRIADIRTAAGTVRRAFSKICPLFQE